jgi:hypothetical protein
MKVNLNIVLFITVTFLACISNTANASNSFFTDDYRDIFQSIKYQNDNQKKDNLSSHFLFQKKLLKLSEKVGLIDDFNPAVRVNPIYNNYNSVLELDIFPLDWRIIKPDEKHWSIEEKIISRSYEADLNNKLAIHVSEPNFANQWKSVKDYDELWIDYNLEEGGQLCGISTHIDFIGDDSLYSQENLNNIKERWSVYSSEKPILTKKYFVDAKQSQWIKKDYVYFLSRALGLSPDNHLHYSQDGTKVVVQKRVHWEVNQSSSLIVEFSNLSEIVGANLSLIFEDEYGGSELIPINLIGFNSGSAIDGVAAAANIGQIIANTFPEKMATSRVHINEIFLHFNNDNPESFEVGKDLHSISLMEVAAVEKHNTKNLFKVFSIDAINSFWSKSSFTNKFKQLFFGVQGADSWNWNQINNGIKVKKTLNWALQPNSKLAIYVDRDALITSISLQFGTKEKEGSLKTLHNMSVTKLADGKFAILLDLDNLLEDQLLESMDDEGGIIMPILNHISITLTGSSSEIIGNSELRGIALLGIDPSIANLNHSKFVLKNHSYPIDFKTEKVGINKGRKIIDLLKVTEAGNNMIMNDAMLFIYPLNIDEACQIEITSISLVDTYKSNRLSYLSLIEKWKKKYNGYFSDGLLSIDFLEGLKFLAYSSPSAFYNAKEDYEKTTNIPVSRTGDVLVSKITTTSNSIARANVEISNYKRDSSENKWLSVDDIQLTSSGKIISVNPYDGTEKLERSLWKMYENFEDDQYLSKGVQIEGDGGDISLFWPTKAKLDKQSMFYFSIPKGEENIHSIQLKINGKNGEKWRRSIKANEPVLLTNKPIEIDSVEIKLYFNESVFDFVLDELAIVSPVELNMSRGSEEVLMFEIPWKDGQILESGLSSKGVEALNLLTNNKTYWTKEIDSGWVEAIVPNPSTWTERIGISYQVPSEWLGFNGCILEGDFIFANQTLHRSFCLSQASGEVSFSAAELGFLGQEKLDKIVWHLQKPKGESGYVKLGTWVNMRGMSSIYNQIQHTPLLYLGNQPYYLSNDNLQEIFSQNRWNWNGFWSSLPQSFLNKYLEYPEKLKINKNPWLEVEERIAVSPKKDMDFDKWTSFSKPIELEKAFNWLWFKLIGFVLFAWLVIVICKGWRLKIQSAVNSIISSVLWRLPQILVKQFWKIGPYLSRWINVLIGIVLVPLFANLSALINVTSQSYILLASSMLLGVNVYRHWRQFGLLEKRSDDAIFLNLVWGLFFVIILLTFYLAGRQNIQIQWYIIAAPLLSAYYGVLPQIVSKLLKISIELLKTILWLHVLLILYFVSFALSTTLSTTLSTLGGIAAVMAWRGLVGYFKPSVESWWPDIAVKIYRGSGTHYFIGFIVILIGVAFMLMLGLEPIAEQLAIIGYYMLAVGVVIEMYTLRRDKNESNKQDSIET